MPVVERISPSKTFFVELWRGAWYGSQNVKGNASKYRKVATLQCAHDECGQSRVSADDAESGIANRIDQHVNHFILAPPLRALNNASPHRGVQLAAWIGLGTSNRLLEQVTQ
jgi:hypothetical protein